MKRSAIEFAEKWYVVKQAVIDAGAVRFLYEHALALADIDTIAAGDRQVPGAPVVYADPHMDTLLETLRGEVEMATQFRLWPTYSYLRVYRNGNVLRPHRDREPCEISMTLNLGADADGPWPIWIAGPLGTASVSLNPGDGLIYRGCDCYHWREPFAGRHLAQVFLHYVNRDGPHSEWKFDKRPHLAKLLD
ncbi:MAG TPA: hypothetical protein VGJ21_14515 [Terracidiphilus sp.]|jgi:hypothetical protein